MANSKPSRATSRTVSLENVLPKEALDKLDRIVEELSKNKLKGLTGRHLIFEILTRNKGPLEKKGICPESLSWVLAGSAKGIIQR